MRVGEGMRTFGALKGLWNVGSVNVRAKRELYERVVVPTVMCENTYCTLQDRFYQCVLRKHGV